MTALQASTMQHPWVPAAASMRTGGLRQRFLRQFGPADPRGAGGIAHATVEWHPWRNRRPSRRSRAQAARD
jgi:hypothetical protein